MVRAASASRMRSLLKQFGGSLVQERKELVTQWGVLADAGVPLHIVAKEFGVSKTTIITALRDPDHWVSAPTRSGRSKGGSRQLGKPRWGGGRA